MPEGHTLHRLAQDIARDLLAHPLTVTSPQGRFDDANQVDQQSLRHAEAIGKHLLLHFSNECIVHVHLGLFGRFRRHKLPAPEARATTRMRLLGPSHAWDLSGPTACALLGDDELAILRARIGADPLSATADVASAWSAVHRTRRAMGAVLLDQSVISGLGNIYRAEILFLAGVHPETRGCDLPRAAFDQIWADSQRLLARGVKERRIATVPAPPGTKRLKRSESLYVYHRAICRVCAGPIGRVTLAARPCYFCPQCQPLSVHA